MLAELLPAETGHLRHVHGPICGDSNSVNYLFCGSQGSFWSQTIEHSKFVFGSKETPGVASRAVALEGEGAEGWGRRHFVLIRDGTDLEC